MSEAEFFADRTMTSFEDDLMGRYGPCRCGSPVAPEGTRCLWNGHGPTVVLTAEGVQFIEDKGEPDAA